MGPAEWQRSLEQFCPDVGTSLVRVDAEGAGRSHSRCGRDLGTLLPGGGVCPGIEPDPGGFPATTSIQRLCGHGQGEDAVRAFPAKVVRIALEHAASVAGMLLTTECVIADIPENEPAMPPMGGGGMPGMM